MNVSEPSEAKHPIMSTNPSLSEYLLSCIDSHLNTHTLYYCDVRDKYCHTVNKYHTLQTLYSYEIIDMQEPDFNHAVITAKTLAELMELVPISLLSFVSLKLDSSPFTTQALEQGA